MSATNRGAQREERDRYPTPWYCLQAIMKMFDWDEVESFLEPCKGEGRILTSVPKGVKRSWCEIDEGRDYLRYKPRKEFDVIVTNPPFSLALDFLTRSLAQAKTVAYLLRLNWLASVDRAEFFYHNQPDYVFPLAPRPSFQGKGNDACEYGWIVWDRGEFVIPNTPSFVTIGIEEKGGRKRPIQFDDIILPPSLRKPARSPRPVRGGINVEDE